MTIKRWAEIESKVLLPIAKMEVGSCDEVSFVGVEWQRGVKVVDWSNRRSEDFLTQVIRVCGEICQR